MRQRRLCHPSRARAHASMSVDFQPAASTVPAAEFVSARVPSAPERGAIAEAYAFAPKEAEVSSSAPRARRILHYVERRVTSEAVRELMVRTIRKMRGMRAPRRDAEKMPPEVRQRDDISCESRGRDMCRARDVFTSAMPPAGAWPQCSIPGCCVTSAARLRLISVRQF